MQPNLPILAHRPGALTEPEHALEPGGLDGPAMRLAQDDLLATHSRHAPAHRYVYGPSGPKTGSRPRTAHAADTRAPLRTTDDVRIQHPALDGKAAFGQVLPGMALGDRRPWIASCSRQGCNATNTAP